jgi:hypothetical protein
MRLSSFWFTAILPVILVLVITFSVAAPALAQHDEGHDAAGQRY